jgi:hypothetical protein
MVGAPFGGHANSGFGTTDSADALLEDAQINAVPLDAGRA